MKNKITIAFFINGFNIGGAERLYLDLFRHLDTSLYDMHLFTLLQFKNRPDFYSEIPDSIPVHRFNFKNFYDLKEWLSLFFALCRLKPTVVVSSLFFSNTITRILSIFSGCRVIVVEHNTYVNKTKFQIMVDRVLSRVTCRIVAVSKSVFSFTSAQENIPEEKFIVIHNGLDFSRIDKEIANSSDLSQYLRELGFLATDKIVIAVGRLAPQKNHSCLIEGFAKFCRGRSEYKLIILGEGGIRRELEGKIRNLKSEKNIFLIGVKKNIFPYYLMSEFFVSSSFIEGFGIAHAEALYSGLPVLTTKTAGPDEMINEGVNGYFVEEATPEGIEAGLLKMASASFDRGIVRASVLPYSIEETARKYSDIIKRCAE